MFRLGKQRKKIVALADVGSASAAVAILQVEEGKPAQILVAERAFLPVGERSGEATASGVVQKLGEAGEAALKKYTDNKRGRAGPIVASYIAIRPPWVRSKTTRVVSEFEKETLVSGNTISDLAKEALAQDKEFDHSNILEANVIRTDLNGYPTHKPEGKHARTVAVAVLLSECVPSIRTGVIETMSRLFPGAKPVVRSGVRTFLPVLHEYNLLPHNGIIASVTDGTIDLIVVRKGLAAEHELIPEGIKTILKQAAPERPPEESLTLMRLLLSGGCEDAACEAFKAALARIELELVKKCGEVFGKLAAGRRIANTFILSTQSEFAPWLSQFFSRIDFAQFTMTTQPFVVKTLTHDTLFTQVSYAPGVSFDIGLAICAALVNIEEHAGA